MTIIFKNVGQGDSIIIEWERDAKSCFGLIDCNVFEGRNPTLEFLIARGVTELEFIVLSHFHYDHFSGLPAVFKHCCEKKVHVKFFFHTLMPFVSDIYSRIFTSQKIQGGIVHFFNELDSFVKIVDDSVPVSSHIASLELTKTIRMSFLAPMGKIYDVMAKQLARKVNKITSSLGDINKLSTIILIEENVNNECAVITSDAVKKSFKKVKIISGNAVVVQAPHHGSWLNIDDKFWSDLKRKQNCPAVFSVGYAPKDKLPNVETVAYFDKKLFDVHSTNVAYGIADYFLDTKTDNSAKSKSTMLNSFSTLRKSVSSENSKLNGDQQFTIF